MTSQLADRTHPVAHLARTLSTRLEQLAEFPVWAMTPEEVREALTDLTRAQAQLDGLRLRVLAQAERSRACSSRAAATAADWLAVETRQTHRTVRADLRLAQAVETHPVLEAALARGQVNPAQARAIVTALDRLPDSGRFAVTAQQRTSAEAHLVMLAAHHDARDLAVLGRRVFEVVAPELAEQFEGKVLADQEAAALRRTVLTMREDHEGTCHGRFRIPVLHGHILSKLLLALTSPTREAETVIDPELPHPVRQGLAFCELLESVPPDHLPSAGGATPTVVVTMTLEQLEARLTAAGVCDLDTGAQVTAGEARRLACTAGVIPAVLGGASQVLDLGRRRRFHTPAQRLAMTLRDRGCTASGCERPASMCHAHHDVPWSRGGPTSVDNGRLLCGHHHRRLHDPTWNSWVEPTGKVAYHRRE